MTDDQKATLRLEIGILFLLATFVAAVFLFAGCVTTQPQCCGIPNFGKVAPGIYRGGQPDEWAWGYLHALGISNVVKLDLESEGSDREAKQHGMRVVYVPMSTCRQILGPMQYQVWVATTNIYPGTFIHCSRGKNRTGLVVGCYRVWHDGWTKKRARAEMERYGWADSFVGLKWFWNEKVKEHENAY